MRRLRFALALRVASLDDAGTSAMRRGSAITACSTPPPAEWMARAGRWARRPPRTTSHSRSRTLPGLAGIDEINCQEIDAQGNEVPWRPGCAPIELVLLAEDALRIRFEPLELAGMKRLAPDFFDRRFDDLVETGRSRLPSLAPRWTDYNAHDPGITLMELLGLGRRGAVLFAVAHAP